MNASTIRKEYEDRLYQHPSLKAIRGRAQSSSKKTPVAGAPKLIAIAMQDEETAGAITAFRRVRDYETKVGDLARRRLMKEAVPLSQEETLAKKGKEAETDFRTSIGTLARKARLNPDLGAYGQAAREIPVPAEILGDIPSYLNQDEREAMAYLGWGPEHAVWKEIAEKGQEGKGRTALSDDDMAELLQNIENSAPKLDYSLSPRHLHEQGILTIGGNDWVEDLIAIALFFLIFLPWLFWEFVRQNAPWIVEFILGALGFPV